jgi:hypothetical protein
MALSPAERDLLLGVLADPPDGLVELRGKLARDHRHRQVGAGRRQPLAKLAA